MSREIVWAEVIELDTDLDPHQSMPAQLADALDHFAAHFARAASGK